ncbi:MAG: hypothetical protein CMD31_07075 [Flavobacteriales bacterium]|nr:hypothetical protein [Flavobacteriales bacterium]|tara:strand:+ start:5985 stop:7646 length:1662 start_codon:yes stop_codon:yes gene_type:complete
MKTCFLYIAVVSIFIFNKGLNAQSFYTMDELKSMKMEAVDNNQYRLAKVIQDEIDKRNSSTYKLNKEAWEDDSLIVAEVNELEKQQKRAVVNENWLLAKSLKTTIFNKKYIKETEVTTSKYVGLNNRREDIYQEMLKKGFVSSSFLSISENDFVEEDNSTETVTKIGKTTDQSDEFKYRRSSLYTLMINDNQREHFEVILNAFGNTPLSEKFNDHNIGPYLIDATGYVKDRSSEITVYLEKNNVAKDLVAKWFNRSKDGAFDMSLIQNRGEYSATVQDKVVAANLERGEALLADAGEELIGNTYVIINDFKFTNKEEVAKKVSNAAGWAKLGASYLPGGSTITNTADVVDAGATIAGKGYIIKTTSYLYKLDWNDSIAAVFYNNLWVDQNNLDPAKIAAFEKSGLFKLRLVGYEDAWADLQSSIFTNKSDEELIYIATIKAVDKAIAKLQRKYEEFRTKTPLTSVDPLTAKIGLKEGLEPNDKYEVLEQTMDENGKISYKRKSIIRAQKGMIWDNTYVPEDAKGQVPQQNINETHFIGSKAGLYPGMLIRQIN